jgi:hypothetical protein
MTALLEEFSSEEIEQVLELSQQFKGRFAQVAAEIFEGARHKGMSEQLAMRAVANECLLLAAYLYGDGDSFRALRFQAAARRAYEWAERNRPKRQAKVQ